MDVNELLKVLHDAGLDDEGIEVLLAEAIKVLHKDEEEMEEHNEEVVDDEKAAASDLLGVSL